MAQIASNRQVDKPKHYDVFPGQQAIDLIRQCLSPAEYKGFLKGNILKYRLRAGQKDALQQDIDKANWYRDELERVTREKPITLSTR